jgi:hypothetical protein
MALKYLPVKVSWFRLPEYVTNLWTKVEKGNSISDTFTTNDGKTVTVVDGIVTSIV